MQINPCKEQICTKEIVYDNTVEQSVEMEYVLPDYYPNVFKILKTSIETKVLSKIVSNRTKTIFYKSY